MREARGAALAAIPEPDRMDRGEVARRALREEATLDRLDQPFRDGMTRARTADEYRVPVANERGGLACRDDLHWNFRPQPIGSSGTLTY